MEAYTVLRRQLLFLEGGLLLSVLLFLVWGAVRSGGSASFWLPAVLSAVFYALPAALAAGLRRTLAVPPEEAHGEEPPARREFLLFVPLWSLLASFLFLGALSLLTGGRVFPLLLLDFLLLAVLHGALLLPAALLIHRRV